MNRIAFIILTSILGACTVTATTQRELDAAANKYKVVKDKVCYFDSVQVTADVDEALNRAVNYFVYNYVDGKSVIQNQNTEIKTVIGKGVYSDISGYYGFTPISVDCSHIIKVDIDQGYAKIYLSLVQYKVTTKSGVAGLQTTNKIITNTYPFNPKGTYKPTYAEIFLEVHNRSLKSIESMKDALLNGNL